jgi:hypothetical protein
VQDTTALSNEALLAIFAAIQVLSVALSKVIDYFVDKSRQDPVEAKIDKLLENDDERQEHIKSNYDMYRMIADMYAMHKVIDDEGRPVWYFPKKMLDMADKHLELLRDISNAQKETASKMESIVSQLMCIKAKHD